MPAPSADTGFSSIDRLAEGIDRRGSRAHEVQRAWARFAPELTYGRHRMPSPPGARQAAVMVLLYRYSGDWYLPLIERTSDATVHSGQVSFPGGAMEANESPEAAALRELDEELGVSAAAVRILGRLTTTYIYASDFVVTPCVGVTDQRPEFRPSPDEVAQLLELPLSVLRDPAHVGEHQIRRRGLIFRAPHIEFRGRCIWGATSMMLSELLALWGDDTAA